MMVWPVLTVGYRYAAVTTRMTRSTLPRGAAGGLHPHRLGERAARAGASSSATP